MFVTASVSNKYNLLTVNLYYLSVSVA